MRKYQLTKSLFVSGLKCPKALYLSVTRPETQAPLTALDEKTLAAGKEVQEAARKKFPAGVLIHSLNTEIALQKTEEAIKAGALTLFEAAFLYDDILVRVDILSRKDSLQPWDFYEVKATTYNDCDTEQKAEYRNDIGIQIWVLQQLNISIGRIYLMHLNKECRYPNLENLFSIEDYSTEITPVLTNIRNDIDSLKKTISEKEAPPLSIGPHCDKPRSCPFKGHCWQNIPKPSIFNIPRNLRKWEQLKEGSVSISSLGVSDFKSETQQRALLSYKEQNLFFDAKVVTKLLSQWEYPLSYLDFEAIDYPIPRYSGSRPYQHIPFQFSCHIQRTPDAKIEHKEFLWISEGDPRPSFIQELLACVPLEGSIVVYSASYESTRLKELAEDFPDYRDQLNQIRDRLVDLKVVIEKGVYHPEFMGSFSIKKVAPALLGNNASYSGMEVGDGVQAMLASDRMVSLPSSSDEKSALVTAMLEYCRKDTMLMVDLHSYLNYNRTLIKK